MKKSILFIFLITSIIGCTPSNSNKSETSSENVAQEVFKNFGLSYDDFIREYNQKLAQSTLPNIDQYKINKYEKDESMFNILLNNGVEIHGLIDKSGMINSIEVSYSILKDDYFSAFEFVKLFVGGIISKHENPKDKGNIEDLLTNLEAENDAIDKVMKTKTKQQIQRGSQTHTYELKENTFFYTVTAS